MLQIIQNIAKQTYHYIYTRTQTISSQKGYLYLNFDISKNNGKVKNATAHDFCKKAPPLIHQH